jgi:uncharacterized protein
LILLTLACLLVPVVAHALEVPPLKGRVNDTAEMLSGATEQYLDRLLRDLETSDSTQIVVLTIDSLEGDSLEDFSIRVAEQWKIGQQGLDNGAILLIARAERKLRIEVGYGLEGRLTDLAAGRIIRNVIVPRFKSGQVDQGVIDGVQAMAGVVRGEFSAAEAPPRGNQNRPPGNVFFGLMLALFILNVLGRLRRSLGALAGAVIVPIIGTAVFGFSLVLLLVLIPVGIAAGLLASFLGAPLVFGSSGHRRGGGGFWIGGGGGMGGGGFGGFSGGGGGFGGGGASGGW